MYAELIEQLSPKPKFNLTWYKNEDLYSDGDIEDTLIKIISEHEPEDYSQAICDNYCWPTYYHLTHTRANIINWYPFNPDASVLEIGCGLGAITGTLCDLCKDVTAVELSKRRATATLLRCREKENLEIIVGNLNDIEFEKKFDYITLIGVFEYQGSYTDGDNPYNDFLTKVKSLLKPNGKLLIAIENQYGLKYWCGAGEDHTSIPFDGINQYSISNRKIRTFSRKGLEKLIKESGFKNTFFYYPQPDYKLPFIIYSEDYLPKELDYSAEIPWYYIPSNKTLVADEARIYNDIIENNTFEFFSNSFFVECSDSDELGEVKFISFSHQRLPNYRVGTRIYKDRAEKFPLNQAVETHLHQTVKNEAALSHNNLSTANTTFQKGMAVTQYMNYPTYEELLSDAYKTKNKAIIYNIFDRLNNEILASSKSIDPNNNILFTLDLDIEPDINKYGTILKTGFLDMTPKNAFCIDNNFVWFDQEWILENIPASFIMYRSIETVYNHHSIANDVLPKSELFERYGITAVYEEYRTLDSLFLGTILDTAYRTATQPICQFDVNIPTNNICKLLNIKNN